MSEPRVYIQWKGTNLCGDFYCECGYMEHIDAYFVYRVACPNCGSIYEMPTDVFLKKVEDSPDECTHYFSEDQRRYEANRNSSMGRSE